MAILVLYPVNTGISLPIVLSVIFDAVEQDVKVFRVVIVSWPIPARIVSTHCRCIR